MCRLLRRYIQVFFSCIGENFQKRKTPYQIIFYLPQYKLLSFRMFGFVSIICFLDTGCLKVPDRHKHLIHIRTFAMTKAASWLVGVGKKIYKTRKILAHILLFFFHVLFNKFSFTSLIFSSALLAKNSRLNKPRCVGRSFFFEKC